jgi:hypothetical protein
MVRIEPRHDKNQHNGFATSMDTDQPAQVYLFTNSYFKLTNEE